MDLPLTADTRKKSPAPVAAARAPSAPEAETDASEPETRYRLHRRFDRAARLFSEPGMERLSQARVLVIGVGGVGTFAAESLARSGVGKLALVDFDKVCITNTNRQLHAMKGCIGRHKVDVMAERLRLVHPTADIEAVKNFYNAESSAELLSGQVDFVIDAIDNLTAKAHLVATCIARKIPLVSSMGAAARLDPTMIRVDDLSNTQKDPFARALRKILAKEYQVEAVSGQPVGVTAVYSIEEPQAPHELSYDEGQGFVCVCPGGKNGLNDCDRKARIDGTASFVTGSFGLHIASVVVRQLLSSVKPLSR
jgi:tRNA A37 threonylcarbamoyladenosine dehydratase